MTKILFMLAVVLTLVVMAAAVMAQTQAPDWVVLPNRVAASSYADQDGVSRTATYKAMAGTVYCVFTAQTPAALTGVHIECVGPGATLTQDTVLALEPALGQKGQFISGRDLIKWQLRAPLDGHTTYTVEANGKKSTGSL